MTLALSPTNKSKLVQHNPMTHESQIFSRPTEAIAAIKAAEHILILISGPDGDSLGAGIVLKRYLLTQRKIVRLVSGNPLTQYLDLPLIQEIEFADVPLLEFGQYDLIITLDTANPYPQLVDYTKHRSFRLPSNPPSLSIDHHRGNENYAQLNIWEPEASSTCEMVFSYFLSGTNLSNAEATLLLIGISSDTGHFRWATTGKTFEIVSALIDMGADLDLVVYRHYYSYDQSTVLLLRDWLNQMTYNSELGYMVVTITEREVDEMGLSPERVREARSIFQQMFLRAVKGYPIGFFLIENGNITRGQIVGSTLKNRVDLTRLSLLVGGNGGGHFNASGFIIAGTAEDALQRIDEALKELGAEYTHD